MQQMQHDSGVSERPPGLAPASSEVFEEPLPRLRTCLILPAAGKATRWKSAVKYKELLPMKRNGQVQSLLQHALYTGMVGGAEAALIITKTGKIQAQAGNVESMEMFNGMEVFYTLQPPDKPELWGAIQCSFNLSYDRYFFVMPDTFFPEPIFMFVPPHADFWLGTFETSLPHRYGVIDTKGWISDKGDINPYDKTYAWGVAAWSHRVVQLWKDYGPYDDYAEAFNRAILHFGFKSNLLRYYHDMANYDEYQALLEIKELT